ncbi:MAG: transposase [Pirellulales bacterium]|nr:transposase [Pirellulales bacterium]
MSDFKRWYVPGGTYFFTVVCYQRSRLFEHERARRLLGDVIRRVRQDSPFHVVASVLLWDHLHMVWSMPTGDCAYSDRWRRIKRDFTVEWLAAGGVAVAVKSAQARRGHRGIWQRRFFEHLVRDESDLDRICDYVHFNPVKHGYVESPWDWQWSTFRRFVSAGQYTRAWGAKPPPHAHTLAYDCE